MKSGHVEVMDYCEVNIKKLLMTINISQVTHDFDVKTELASTYNVIQ